MPRGVKRIDLYRAKVSFSCEVDGEPIFVTKGETVRQGHPILRSQSENFEPVDTNVTYDVEQATAAPGEVRG